MVDTWTPVFNLSDKDKINKQTLNSDRLIEDVISKIASKNQGILLKESYLNLPVIFLEKSANPAEKPVICILMKNVVDVDYVKTTVQLMLLNYR